jgi:phosphate transport system permease protein
LANYATRKLKDRLAYGLGIFCLVLAIIPILSILFEVVRNGISTINLQFLTSTTQSGGGIAQSIQGTLILVGLTCLVGVPLGLMSGVYLSEFGDNRVGRTIRFLNDVLTGFPSIIAGILVATLLVTATKTFSPVAGAMALSVIMLPIVSRTTEESLKLVPNSIRDAAMALGIRRWRTTMSIILSTARGGVITGILLSISRVSGETAPLVLTILGTDFLFAGWNQPIDALPLRIFNDRNATTAIIRQQAWGAALVLILIVLTLNVAVRLATRRRYNVDK